MGKGGSKEKKKGGSSKSDEPAPKDTKAAATEEEDDPWDAPCVFSKDKKAVGVEDFDLMAVIGKGSFGKVRGEPSIHPSIHPSTHPSSDSL